MGPLWSVLPRGLNTSTLRENDILRASSLPYMNFQADLILDYGIIFLGQHLTLLNYCGTNLESLPLIAAKDRRCQK